MPDTRYLLIIGDGMGDEPVPALDGRTPLEAAFTPTLDRLAAAGEQLLVRTVPEGFPPGSDVANLSLLGYEPEAVYTGRAPLEAASMGVDLAENELAFRCNLVTLEEQGERVIMRDYSAGHISTREAGELIHAVENECRTSTMRLVAGISYRHLLVYRGHPPDLLTTPPHDHLDQDVTEWVQRYQRIPELKQLLSRAARILAEHPVNRVRREQGKNPANALWLWGEGGKPEMEPLTERYGISGGLVSAVDLLKGLAVYAGLEVAEVEGATGTVDTDYEGKVAAALDILSGRDLAVVHLEGPDEAGHQGNLADKVRAIENLDRLVVAPLVREMEKKGWPYRLVVCMDHYTPLSIRTHVDWPVPLLLYDSRGTGRASGSSYTENHARRAARDFGLVMEDGAEFFGYFITGKRRGRS